METGTRVRKPVDYSDYYTGDEIDQAFIDYGIDPAFLAQDDENGRFLNLSAGTFSLEEYNFALNDKEWRVTAEDIEEEDAIYIVNFLNSLNEEEFYDLWADERYKSAISALMRYPGGMHEWLMIAAFPTLKCMGIDFKLVKDVRTEINDDFKFVWDNGLYTHGNNTGSAHMHRALLQAIIDAQQKCPNGANAATAAQYLKKHLSIFADGFFNNDCPMPAELYDFINN